MTQIVVQGSGGGKGGGKSHTPVESPNTLQSRATARILDLVSEGEIEGLFDSANPLRSVFFDDVQVEQDGGELNYEGVTLAERVGYPVQSVIQGFSNVESEITVNEEITFASPVIKAITDPDVDALRIKVRVPQLYNQTSQGDLVGTSVNYLIQVQPNGGSYTNYQNKTISGKTTGPYEHQVRITLTGVAFPVNVKISRVTPDSEAATKRNQTFWSSYTEIQEVKLYYPNSAIFGLTVNAELFSGGIPRRSYDIKGIKVKVPSNYDPDTRVYTGLWDGTFQTLWSDNPAWVFYDILTNNRYGLGNYIAPSQVDKFGLYTIGQYCDEMVPNGFGGEEPRFTANGTIASQKEAYDVVQAFASVFRGIVYWSAGGVGISADSPKSSTRLLTEANVIDGSFSYAGTGLKARHSAVAVSWNDPIDSYRQAIELIEDPELINRFSYKLLKVQAFLCTSQGMANRIGRWLLRSEKNETQTVTFTGGFDVASLVPGEVISIADRAMQGARLGGRVVSYEYVDVLPEITAHEMWNVGDGIGGVTTYIQGDGKVEIDNTATFHCVVRVPAGIIPTGCIWEMGSSTSGAYIGFDGNGDLVLRAGAGSATPLPQNIARMYVPNAAIPRGRDLDFVWEIRTNKANRAGRVRLWINNQFFGEQTTSNGTDFTANKFADTSGGAYGRVAAGGVLGEAGNFGDLVTNSGVLLKSVLQYWNDTPVSTILDDLTQDDEFDPAQALSTTLTYGAPESGTLHRDAPGVLSCSIKTPASGTPEGCVFEFGDGSVSGTESLYLGFGNDGRLVFHAGEGGISPDDTLHARIIVPATEFLPDTRYHFIVDFDPDAGRIRLWINFRLWRQDNTAGFGPLQNNQVADTDGGSYGQISGNGLAGDASFLLDFNGELVSALSYYEGEVIGNDFGNFNTGTVTLDADYSSQTGDRILLVSEDGFIDSLQIKGGTTGNTVELLDSPTKPYNANYDTMFILQGEVVPSDWRVINVTETEDMQFEVTALQHDATKYLAIEQDLVIDPPRTTFFPAGNLLAPTELDVTESLYRANNTIRTRIDLSWVASPDPRVALYRVEAKPPDANWRIIGVSSMLQAQILDASEGLWSFSVRALMGSNVSRESAPLEVLDYEIFGKTLPPGDVENFTATRDYASVLLEWDAVTDLDVAGYDIRQGMDWETGVVVTESFNGTSFTAYLEDTSDTTYLIRAIDVIGLYSVNTSRVDTVARTLPAVADLTVHQLGRDVLIRWSPIRRVASLKYEVRWGPTSETWETSQLFATTETPSVRERKSVSASTTFRFRVKPFVALDSGLRIYGPEVTFDQEIHPVIGNSPTKTQTEEPGWSGVYSPAMEVTGSNELALKADKTSGQYVFNFNHASPVFGNLWVEPVWLFLSATELYVFDATMDVFDADFPVTSEINAQGVPQISFEIALDGSGIYQPLIESDYQFTTAKIRITFIREINNAYRPALSNLTTFQNVPTFMI